MISAGRSSAYDGAALAVACPKCAAKAGEECHTIGVWGVSKKWWSYRERPHKQRVAFSQVGPKEATLDAY